MSLVVAPLHPLFVVELRGVDLRKPPAADLIRIVNDAMAKYAVLVIRDQRIDDEQQIRFSCVFGLFELLFYMGMKLDVKRRICPELYDVSNLDVNGDFMLVEFLCYVSNKVNEEFHIDSSFNSLLMKWLLFMVYIVLFECGDI